MQRIERAIAQVYGEQNVTSFLDADTPQPIHLPNHRSISSTPEHAAFTAEQISRLEATGAAKRWPFQRPPRVVLPLGVAANSAGKLRLVLDGGYVNLWAGKSKQEPTRTAWAACRRQHYLLLGQGNGLSSQQGVAHTPAWRAGEPAHCMQVCMPTGFAPLANYRATPTGVHHLKRT